MSAVMERLRWRLFPRWKHPYAHESVLALQQERAGRARLHSWFVLWLAEL